MKGIFITAEGKQELEAKIAELEKPFMNWSREEDSYEKYANAQVYKEILKYATVLPVEESWEHIDENTHTITKMYPQGVVIQPKQ